MTRICTLLIACSISVASAEEDPAASPPRGLRDLATAGLDQIPGAHSPLGDADPRCRDQAQVNAPGGQALPCNNFVIRYEMTGASAKP